MYKLKYIKIESSWVSILCQFYKEIAQEIYWFLLSIIQYMKNNDTYEINFGTWIMKRMLMKNESK